MKKRFSAAVLVLALSACGGGGGGTVPTGGGGGGATPTPSPFPTAGPAGTTASGRLVDYTAGTPIGGAVIVAGTTLVIGATPPPTVPAGDGQTTTAADGSFTVAVAPGSGNIMAFANGYIALHAPETYAAGSNPLGSLKVSTPTSDDTAWLAAINQDRATYSAPPVVMDERLTEAARLWTTYEAANGRGGDSDPLAPAPYGTSITVYGSLGAYNVSVAQNTTGSGVGSSGSDAEVAFRTEGPGGAHFSTIINASARWVGLARMACAGGAGATCPSPEISYTLDILTPPPGV
jgi:Cysteine-rich secretory protein family